MGLKKSINQAVLQAFKTIDDLNTPITYKSLTGQYTRDLDAGTSTPVTQDFNLKYAVFTKFKDSEVDKDISVMTDSKLLFPTQTLGIDPKSSDIVLVPLTGRIWEITRVLSEPSASVTVLQVRRK